MVVSHNLVAINAQRQFGIVNRKSAKSTEKLSSGYRINRAADDAAGLAMSEKMRRQIRGLSQATSNCQDGASFCQIADGAMAEINEMLHRMTELTVKAANGTNTPEDRQYIQDEIAQLKQEIDRIDERTTFNEIPVFAWDRKATNYATDANGTRYITSTETIEVTGNNYGLTEIIGEDHIYSGTKLNDQLSFGGTGWHSTGEVKYNTYSAASQGASSLDDIINDVLRKCGGSLTRADLNTYLSNPSTDTGYLKNNANGTYIRIQTATDGAKDLDGNTLWKTLQVDTGSYDPVTDTMSKNQTSKYYRADGGYGNASKPGATGLDGGKTYGSAWIDFSGLGTDYEVSNLVGQGFNSTCATCYDHYSIYFTDNGPDYQYSGTNSSPRVDINISSCTTGDEVVQKIMDAINGTNRIGNHYTSYAYNDSEPAKLYIYDARSHYNNGGMSKFEPAARDGSNKLIINKSVLTDPATGDVKREINDAEGIWIQAGSEPHTGFYIKRAKVNSAFLTVDSVDVTTAENAEKSLSLIKNGLHYISEQRSYIGAQQNRIEHTINNLDNVVENTTAAESAIRDTDMAKMMVEYSNSNILKQAGQSMMAQANQSNQGVLSLLQ